MKPIFLSRLYFLFFTSLNASSRSSLRFRTGIKICLGMSDHYLTSSKSLLRIQHGVFHSVRWSLECLLCLIFSRTPNANPPFIQRLDFPQFLQRRTLSFLQSMFVPICWQCSLNKQSWQGPHFWCEEKNSVHTKWITENLNRFSVHNPIHEYK